MIAPKKERELLPPERKRSKQLKIWVSPEEQELIRQKMAEFGTANMGAFVRKMVIDGYIVKLDMPNKIYVKIQAENSPTGQAEKCLTGGAFFDQRAGRKVPPNNNKSNKYVRNYEPKEGVSL